MQLVIGSGPASVAAVSALVSKGLEVTVIEPGRSLEKSLQATKEQLGKLEPSEWPAEELSQITSKVKSTTKGIPKKLVYGSSYVYKDVASAPSMELKNAKMTRSFALGGLSNVWGACILPYPGDELVNWPIGEESLAPHYKAVLDFVPHTGVADNLSERLPLYSDNYSELPLSQQATSFLEDLNRGQNKLTKAGLFFGRSRLAVKHQPQSQGECRNCAMCLYGCPYDLIYSTAHTLQQLLSNPLVHYRPNLWVHKISERNNLSIVHATNTETGESVEIEGDRTYLGAGVVESTRIVAESLGAYDQDIKVRHSDRFMLPFMRFKGTKGVYTENLNTLCQLFLEIHDKKLSKYDVHLQAYSYNDLYKKALEAKFGPLSKALAWPMQEVLSRLIIMFGYIHSEESSSLNLKVLAGKQSQVVVEGVPSNISKQISRAVFKKLLLNFRQLKGVPALPVLDPPGGGNHTGGTIPMRAEPGEFESDILGRPSGFKYLHVVDSSVFPSLPAATITLSIMANSHRIASNAGVSL